MTTWHKVRANLRGEAGPDNKIFIDDVEIRNVTEFYVRSIVGKRATVTITFFADFDGEFSDAQQQDIAEREAAP